MASKDIASELEKGLQELSPVSDISLKERFTESTNTETTSKEKASYYARCTY